jgi:hypothetical protein
MSATIAPGADEDPLWKKLWKRDGIRYLGPDGKGGIDAMERFRHAFHLGYEEGLLRGLELSAPDEWEEDL